LCAALGVVVVLGVDVVVVVVGSATTEIVHSFSLVDERVLVITKTSPCDNDDDDEDVIFNVFSCLRCH